MKALVNEPFKNCPQLIIAPDSVDLSDWSHGNIVITPINIDIDQGKRVISPIISVNVRLGNFSEPDRLIEWADALKTSAMIAKREYAPWFSESVNTAALNLWARVDQILK
jgi:hypothetical protein